jgi:hypothetical protein
MNNFIVLNNFDCFQHKDDIILDKDLSINEVLKYCMENGNRVFVQYGKGRFYIRNKDITTDMVIEKYKKYKSLSIQNKYKKLKVYLINHEF